MRVTSEQRSAWLKKTADSPFNLWLNAQVRDADGGLDLGLLHDLAKRYGVDRQAQYAHLGPGQQRMNIGNMLRRRVPPVEYQEKPSAIEKAVAPVAQVAPKIERPEVVLRATARELLMMHGQIMD